MEEIYRRDSPLSSENLSESCTAELTRSNSGESSSPTVENSNDDLLQSRNATTEIILFPLFLLDECMGWTNEKHNTFLDCLEASFVEQLRRSIVLRAGCVELNRSCRNLSQKLSAPSDIASKQFTARRYGCSKINIESDQSELFVRKGDDTHHVTDLQFVLDSVLRKIKEEIRGPYLMYLKKDQTCSFSSLQNFRNQLAELLEGSGQNFVDEDFEENSRSKKLKTAMMDTADYEQIVPKEQPTPCSSERKK